MTSRFHQRTVRTLPQCLHQVASSRLHGHRTFTTTPARPYQQKRVAKNRRVLVHNLEQYKSAPTLPPPYPYSSSQKLYKQADTGLYGGMRIQFGNNVSRKNEIKTRRTWRPNIVRKNLYSLALGRMLKLKVATRVLRTIDKVGGLDEYLLGCKAARLKELGEEGWRLRWVVLQALKDSDRVRGDQRLMLELFSGLPRDGSPPIDTTVDIGIPGTDVVEGGLEETPGRSDQELEEAMQQRFEEERLMREERPQVASVLQRVGQAITSPFKAVARFFTRR